MDINKLGIFLLVISVESREYRLYSGLYYYGSVGGVFAEDHDLVNETPISCNDLMLCNSEMYIPFQVK